jgi:amino acid adenylation domain-containing protein
VPGELFVGGEGVSRGYLNNEALTMQKFMVNPYDPAERLYRSGDLARLMDNGELEYLGRIDNQVKIRGFRIELGEIESQVLKHSQVADVVVIDKKDASHNTFLCAYIVAKDVIDIAALRAHLLARLPDHMVPAYFVQINSIPQTSNGKVNRRLLPEPEIMEEEDHALPRNSMEEMLVKIWASVLKIPEPGINSNFFSIGGDSMKAVKLLSAVKEATDVKVGIADLFLNPTIASFASCMANAGTGLSSKESELLNRLHLTLEQQKHSFISANASLHVSDIEDAYPASDIEAGMIFHALKEPGIYHDQMVHTVRYPQMDIRLLDRALELMTQKHSILRTAFYQHGSELFQVVFKSRAHGAKHFDLANNTQQEQVRIIREYLQQDKETPFQIEEPGLWRFVTYKLSGDTYCVCFICHHAIIDGWSDASFNTELNNIFITLQHDPGFVPDPLQSSYRDYVIDQLVALSSKETTTYWQNELSEYKRFSFELEEHDNGFYTRNEKLDDGLRAQLIAKSKQLNVSMKNLCFSAYIYALNLFSYNNDITAGLVVNNRPEKEDGDKILGCFLNTVPVRITIPKNTSWKEYILSVNRKLNHLKKHDKVSLSRIVEMINEQPGTRNPVIDVMFNYVDFHVYNELQSGASSLLANEETQDQFAEAGGVQDNYLFSLTVDETGGEFIYSLSYAASFINNQYAAAYLDYFRNTLQMMACTDDVLISKRSIMPAAEVRNILQVYNDTRLALPSGTLTGLFEAQVHQSPANIAVIFQEEILSYTQLNERANQLAHYLRSKNVKPGDIVALLVDRSVEMLVGIIGIMKSGAAYLPLDVSQQENRISDILNDCNAVLLLTEAKYLQEYKNNITAIDIRSKEIRMQSTAGLQLSLSPSGIAYIIYTSGSTGKPKGVMVRHNSVVNCIYSRKNIFNIHESERILQFSTISFDASVEQIWLALLSGAAVVLIEKEAITDTEKFNACIAGHRITHLDTTPSFLESMELRKGNSLQRIIAGGEECKPGLAMKLYKDYQLYNEYGPTETTIVSIACLVTDEEISRNRIPIGRPISNTFVYVLDQHLDLLPTGVKGELYIGGEGVTAGYMNDEALTSQKFIDDPFVPGRRMYRTGDMARWLPGGTIEFLGRMDAQVKIRGFRIELGEIENRLAMHPQIQEAVVLAKERQGDNYLVAYYVSLSEIAVQELKQFLGGRLPDYMVPAHYVQLKNLPLTESGKINRRALPELDMVQEEYVAPSDEIEEKLVAIWSEILKIEKEVISVTSSFFALGGHSLKATVLVNNMFREFNVKVPLKDVFHLQSINGLGNFIRAAKVSSYNSIAGSELKEYYKLSSAQKRLYFLYEFDKNSLAYNMPLVVKLEGIISRQHLLQVFRQLIQRHESLRTSFELVNEAPAQKIARQVDFEMEYFQAGSEEVKSIIKNFIRPFNLYKAPLIRAGLVEISAEENILMIDLHHIVSDGVSHNIFISDFISLYKGELLPPLPVQYKSYAEWQQSTAQQQETARQKDFWLNEFSEEAPVLDLPADHSRPAVKDHAADTLAFGLTKELSDALKLKAEQENVTLYMLLLSIYNVMLAKLSNQEDIVVGTPAAGRQHADLDNIIGMFVNTLPIRNYPKGDMSFKEFLSAVKSKTLACFESQAYQYEDLVDALKLVRDTSRNPLFQTMFAYENFEDAPFDIPGLAFSYYETGHVVSKFDITLSAREAGDSISFDFDYCTGLFRKETIQRFAEYFIAVAAKVATGTDIKISGIEILSANEKDHLLYGLNDTAATYPSHETLPSLFAQQVKKYPGNTALIFNEEHITYKELEESSDGLAHYLKTAGVQEGSNVGLLADRSMEMIIAMLAILKAGGTYMPFDTAQPQQRVLHALRESGARFLLTHRDHMQHYNGHLTVIDIFDSSLYNDAGSIQLSSSPENIAYIIHTSGSTGTPKGVMVTHRSVINFITAQQSFFGITEHDRILQFSSISFDASGEQIWMALLSGAALALASKETLTDNLSLNRYISRHRLTHLHATPSFLESIELYDQSSLKRIVAGGEACKMELAEKFCGQYNFYNKYGPTETTITSIECKVEQNDLCGNTIPIGRPINNTQAYILGKNREVLAQGVKGELYIGGAGLAKGYLQEELTHEKFVAHPFAAGARLYRTGDLARWLSNGMIGFEGRIDDQVKIRGFRIEPGEIESRLKEYPGVTNAIVIAKETGDNKQLVAYYTGSATEAGALKGFLAGRLPDYMVPAHYVHLQLIPLTASGKINRRALPEPQLSEDVNYLAPSGPVEEKLATIWSEILRTGTELIGAYSNFFELGGHSLKTTVLANRIFKEFNVEVPLKEIFSRQTISSLSKFIQGSETSQYASIGKAAPKPYYHLTSAQRRLYFLYQLDKTSLAYNVPQVAKLQGTPDAGRLRNAFEKLIARHESLRTYFEVVREEAVQKIAPQVDFHLEMYTGENVDEVITQFIRPFELHKAPLIRAGLMTIAANEHILMIDAHHIIKDGISEGILVRDFMALYNNDPLPALKLQYKDFAEWQRQPAQQQRIAEQKDFWLKEYAEETNKLELPADFLRPVIMSQEGGSAVFTISAAQAKQLRSIAAKKGATLFMLMFAAYNVLLSKLSNQEDIIVGTPIAGRQHADVDNIIGMFVNTLPVHNYPQGKLPFGEFLSLVKSKMLACFDSQSYPYEELIDELKIVRDTSRNPLFDTLFVYQNFEASVLAIPGLTLTSYDSGHNVAKFDLSFAVQEQEDGLLLSFEYAKALFRHETIERFIGYFQKIISAIIANENVQLAEIKILSEREQYRLLSEFNNTRIEYPQHKTVMHLFEEQALKTPDNVAVITGNTRLSYKEISESSGRMAAYLKQVKGIKPGDLVGLLLEREEQLIPAIFGILKAGAAYVPIDPAYPPKRISAIMEDAALSLLITRQRYLDAAIDINCAVMELDTEMQHVNAQQPSLLADVNPGALAYVIYTSGSTGKPKGVMIEHHSLLNTILCLHKKYPLRASDRYLFKTTYTFDVSAAEIFGWFLEGGAVSLLEPGAAGDSFKILEMVYRERITHMNFVPSMFAIFVEGLEGEGIEKLDSLRYIFLAGEALPADLVNRFHALKTGIRLENIYGPTEATIYACGCPIDQLGDSLNVPIGKPLHNTRLYIVDSSHHLQPIGVAGELCIAGDGLARGYLNNETQTKEKFIYEPTLGERLYKTGDLARWMPDGNIEFLGRIDDQVKIRGFRIELGEIENRLKTYEGITQSVVITKEKQGDKFLVAYYVAPQPLPLQELKNLLLSKLPDYMVPAYYVHLLNMPLTPSGKINRKALPHPEIGDNDSYVAPTGDIEKKLAAIWAEVLRTDESRIGAHSNFFEIGGHSLKATRLLFRIQKLLRSNVSLLDVFRFPTIRQFAQRMQLVKDTANENSDLLVLLSPDPAAQHNFFFLHEGSGDVQGYVTFAGLMKGFNCWGIRSLTLRDYIPQNIELPDMARHYISVMKSIQPHGPYYIAGWSYGGTIIYEMANQLETAGEKVEVLLMIDSQFPVTESRSGFSLDMEFTLEADRSLLFDLLEAKPAPLQNAATMKELWERSLDFFEKGGRGLVKIKNMIPEGIRSILPHLDEIGMEDLVMYVNTIRTLERTMIRYQPAAKLQAQLLYIRALQTELYTDAISSYFKKEVMILEVQTGHFNILQPPFAGQIADKVLTLKNSVV